MREEGEQDENGGKTGKSIVAGPSA